MRRPVGPDFSGWNCVASTRPFCTELPYDRHMPVRGRQHSIIIVVIIITTVIIIVYIIESLEDVEARGS
jgi:hypothetical protein